MKKSMVLSVVVLFSVVSFAQDVPPGPDMTVKRPDPTRVSGIVRRNGGFVYTSTKGAAVYIVNEQKDVPVAVLENVAKNIEDRLGWRVCVVDSTEGKQDVGCRVLVVSKKSSDNTILVAPENGWAEINVSALSKDNPTQDNLGLRSKKEIWRALSLMMGAGNSIYQTCLLKDVRTLADLDAVPAEPCPEPFNKMNEVAQKLNFSGRRRTTYRRACAEGWAPEPKDDIQRAIWEEYKSKPTKPMEIKFDKKLGK